MVISSHVIINKSTILRNNVPLPASSEPLLMPEALYTALQCSYPKFYKMDILCKWATVAAEYLFSGHDLYTSIDKSKIGVLLSTAHGCIDVDKRYLERIDVPSPALFVYTLPNIMLGEICIRHGFKGEQICSVSEKFDAQDIFFATQNALDLGMQACLTGWVDVASDLPDIHLYWVTRSGAGIPFTAASLQELHDAQASN